jgi:hypothetical protein
MCPHHNGDFPFAASRVFLLLPTVILVTANETLLGRGLADLHGGIDSRFGRYLGTSRQ